MCTRVLQRMLTCLGTSPPRPRRHSASAPHKSRSVLWHQARRRSVILASEVGPCVLRARGSAQRCSKRARRRPWRGRWERRLERGR